MIDDINKFSGGKKWVCLQTTIKKVPAFMKMI